MNDITKRLAALALAGFMITSTSGCKGKGFVDPISYVSNTEKNGELSGIISLYDLSKYYVIEVVDFEGEHRFYLTYKTEQNPSHAVGYEEYKISGSEVIVATRKLNSEKYTGDYGEIVNVVELIQYIQKYNKIKEGYKPQEIEEIMNQIHDDYQKNKEVKTKSLTLKQK